MLVYDKKTFEDMGKLVLTFGRAVLSSKGAAWLLKWVEKNPGKTAIAAGLLLDQIVQWVINFVRHNKVDVGSLVSALRKSIPSVQWSNDRDKLIVQMKDYAAGGPSQRAALFQAMNESGFNISLPPEIIGYLESASPNEQDRLLIDTFKASADKAIPSDAQTTPPFEVVMLRTELIEKAANIVGGMDNLAVLRNAVLTIDQADIDRAETVLIQRRRY